MKGWKILRPRNVETFTLCTRSGNPLTGELQVVLCYISEK